MVGAISSTLADLLSQTSLTSYTVIIALIYYALTIRHNEKTRKQQATLEHLKIFSDETFSRMEALFSRLPNNITPKSLSLLGSDSEVAFHFIGRQLESLGIAVFLGIMDIKVVEKSLGDNVAIYWNKIEPFAREMRKNPQESEFAKYTEWLVSELYSRKKKVKA